MGLNHLTRAWSQTLITWKMENFRLGTVSEDAFLSFWPKHWTWRMKWQRDLMSLIRSSVLEENITVWVDFVPLAFILSRRPSDCPGKMKSMNKKLKALWLLFWNKKQLNAAPGNPWSTYDWPTEPNRRRYQAESKSRQTDPLSVKGYKFLNNKRRFKRISVWHCCFLSQPVEKENYRTLGRYLKWILISKNRISDSLDLDVIS